MRPKPVHLDYARIDANNEAQLRRLREFAREERVRRIRETEDRLRELWRQLCAERLDDEGARDVRLGILWMLGRLSDYRRRV